MKLGICQGGATDTHVMPLEIDFNGLVQVLSEIKPGEKDGPYLTRCAFSDNTRGDASALAMHSVILDGDKRIEVDADGVVNSVNGSFPIEELHQALVELDLTHIIAPSFSNLREGPDYFKQRIWFPVEMTTRAELVAAVAWTIDQLKGKGLELVNVKENNAISQPWYLPRYNDEKALQAFKVLHHVGKADFPLSEAVEWLKTHPQRLSGKAPDLSNILSLSDRTGPVAEVLARHNSAGAVISLLEKHGYEYGRQAGPVGDEPSFFLRAPDSQSGSFGVHVFFSASKGVWITYTHHENDALAGEHAHDYLSLVAALEHDESIRDALAELTVPGGAALPDSAKKALHHVARKVELPTWKLCEQIKLDAVKMSQIIAATVLRQNNTKFHVLAPDGEMLVFLRGDVGKGWNSVFGPFYRADLLTDAAVEATPELKPSDQRRFVAECHAALFETLVDHILTERQFDTISMEVDPFATESCIRSIADGCARFVFTHEPLTEGPIDAAILADYRKHWPMVDEFLRLLCAARFAADRKKAFVWMRAPSDWGKGFFVGALAKHGLVVSMSVEELEKLFSGGPVGRMIGDFKRAWMVEFNEVKRIKGEVKQLEHSVSFAPKGLPTVNVELFLKLFTTAEAIDSLSSEASGVEDQFALRFSYLEPKGNLNERPLFKASKSQYMATIANHVAASVNRLVRVYVGMGRVRAADTADKLVDQFHEAHGLGNRFGVLSVKLPSMVEDFKLWAMREFDNGSAHVRPYCRVKVEGGKRILFAKSVKQLIDLWLNTEFNPAERGKLLWKSNDFFNLLEPATAHRIDYNLLWCTRLGEFPETEDVEGDASEFFSEC